MATNDFENLVRSILEGLPAQSTPLNFDAAVNSTPPGTHDEQQTMTSALRTVERVLQGPAPGTVGAQSSADVARLAAEVEQLRSMVQAPSGTPATTIQTEKQSSIAGTVLKTIGLATGVGPIAAGLMALFGSRSSEPQTYPTLPFVPPPPISVEAGLSADRQFTELSYTADGTPRAAQRGTTGSGTSQAMPPIQITVQAMDSRSFLDHSDDIARAVREAMLHSHSLNDVVGEL
jgi:hypothetical protein